MDTREGSLPMNQRSARRCRSRVVFNARPLELLVVEAADVARASARRVTPSKRSVVGPLGQTPPLLPQYP